MSKNKTFFRNAKEGSMSLGDIFAEVTNRHTPEQTAQVLTAGTALTTPDEPSMLADWQKPFLFARFFLGYVAFLGLAFLMGAAMGHPGGYYILLVAIPFLMPLTILLLVWEMNVPRNISLIDVVMAAALGGILSLLATCLLNTVTDTPMAAWAGLVEEPAKLVVIYMVLSRKNYKYALNGALIGAAVGTGFAVMESLYYVFDYIDNGIAFELLLAVEKGVTLEQALEQFEFFWFSGVAYGLRVAIARAIAAISGHGVFAALYGSALVKAKGEEEIRFAHLLNPTFLAYFAISILLHAMHNYGIDLGLPVFLDGLLRSETIILALVAIGLLLNTLHIGVNQAIAIALDQNSGRFTYAVDREAEERSMAAQAAMYPPVNYGGGSGGEVKIRCIAGPMANQKYRFQEGQTVTIGRSARENAIVVTQCKYVGGVHCRLEVSGGRLFVTDLTSKNGTYLDNQRLAPNQPMPALNGSTIKLGNDECVFKVIIE